MRFQTGQLGNAIKLRIIPYWVGNKNTLPTLHKILNANGIGATWATDKVDKKEIRVISPR